MKGILFSTRRPSISLLRIFLVVIFGFVLLGPGLGLLAASFTYDGNILTDMSDPLNHPGIRNSILLLQGVASAVGLIFLPWYYLKFSECTTLSVFFKGNEKWPMLILVIMIAVVALGLAISPAVEWNTNIQFPDWMAGFGQWAQETERMAEAIVKSITNNLTPLTFVSTFIVVAILPAIGEELVFRGLIQTELQRAFKNPHVGIWVASILFSAIHLQFLGFLPRMLIGAFLGYLYYWSGNLWIPMLGHFFNNGLQLIGLYLFQKGAFAFDMENTESPPWPVVVISIVIVSFLLLYLKNYFQRRLNLPGDSPQQL